MTDDTPHQPNEPEDEVLTNGETVRTSLYIPRELHRQLRIRAIDMPHGTHVNTLINDAIAYYLRNTKWLGGMLLELPEPEQKNFDSAQIARHHEWVSRLIAILDGGFYSAILSTQATLCTCSHLIELERISEDDAIAKAKTLITETDRMLEDAEELVSPDAQDRRHGAEGGSVA